jgi:Cation efflux family
VPRLFDLRRRNLAVVRHMWNALLSHSPAHVLQPWCRNAMAHHLRSVRAAVALNSAIFIGEAIAGLQARSLSLLVDSVHNLSDELALAAIWLAFVLTQGVSPACRAGHPRNEVSLTVSAGLATGTPAGSGSMHMNSCDVRELRLQNRIPHSVWWVRNDGQTLF